MQKTFLKDEAEAKFHILAEVSRQITSILAIEELLAQVVRLIQGAFGYYHVGIGLVEGDEIVYRVGAGALCDDRGFRFEPGRLKIGSEGLTGWVAKSGKPVVVPDVSKDPHYVWMQGSQTRSELVVPISAREQIIGVLDVQSQALDAFAETDLELMQALANQTGVAIHNARLYEQAKQVAVMEERQRLAGELHDSVTQSLYGISLYAEAAAQHHAAGRLDKVGQYLKDIGDTAQESLADMRLLIFELRPPVLEIEGLAAMLQTRLFSVENRAGIKTSLESNLTERLPLSIEDGLYRIANEALNNALKHARARNVTVSLKQDRASVTLEVVDDGIGFDPVPAPGEGCLGLATMSERARSRGWDLAINTHPGQGTSVRIRAELQPL
jgi:signal transduction histidine kinase